MKRDRAPSVSPTRNWAPRSPSSKNRSTFPRSAPLLCLKYQPGTTTRDSAWERFGTKFPSGCKRISETGSWMAARAKRSVHQTQYRSYPYGAFLLKYKFGERLELGAEVFAHAREGYATPQTEASTLIDIGGYYHFKHHPGEQFLFCYGHSVAGQTETYAYIGMYWTWGKDKDKPDTGTARLRGPMNAAGFGNGIE